MNRGYCVPCAPYLYLVPDNGGGTNSGMECLPLGRGSGPPGPFQYLIHEQAKSLQELQNEVGALLEFRDLVIEAFPHLRAKLGTSSGSSSTLVSPSAIPLPIRRHHLNSSPASGLIGVSSSTTNTNTTTTSALVHSTMVTSSSTNSPLAVMTATSEWEPGIRVRRKLLAKEGKSVSSSSSAAAAVAAAATASGGYKSADGSGTSSAASSAVQDSGFSTETSSGGAAAAGSGTSNHASGKDRVGSSTNATDTDLLTTMSPSATCTVTDEAEDELWNLLDVIHRKGTRLREEVESLQNRLSSPVEESGETPTATAPSGQCPNNLTDTTTSNMRRELSGWLSELNAQLRHLPSPTACAGRGHLGRLDGIVSSPARLPKLARGLQVDPEKVQAILSEKNHVELQRHLLTTSVENQALQLRLDHASKSQLSLLEQLDKAKEESDELRFQLEEKNIELEGTRARMRLLEKARGGGVESPSPLVSDVSRRDSVLPLLALPLPSTGTPATTEPSALSHDSSTPDSQSAPASRGSTRHHPRKPSKIPLPRRTTPPPPQLPSEDKMMSSGVGDVLYMCLSSNTSDNRTFGSHSPRFPDSLDMADECCTSDEHLFDSIAGREDCEGEALASCDSLDQLPW